MTDGDIPPHLDPLMIQRLQAMTLAERARRFFDFWDFNRALMLEGIKLRHKDLSTSELQKKFHQESLAMYGQQAPEVKCD